MTVDKSIERDESSNKSNSKTNNKSNNKSNTAEEIKKPSFILSVIWIVLTFLIIIYSVYTLVTDAVFRLDFTHMAVFMLLLYSSIIIADYLK